MPWTFSKFFETWMCGVPILGVGALFSCGSERISKRSSVQNAQRIDAKVQVLGVSVASDAESKLALSAQKFSDSHRSSLPLLEAISDLRIEVKDCASGNHLPPAQTSDLQLYLKDRHCRVLLYSFKSAGESYIGGPFEGIVGDTAVFTSRVGKKVVRIASMIHSPIQMNDTISYTVSDAIAEGADQHVLSLKKGPARRVRKPGLPIGAPHFKLNQVHMINTLPSTRSFGLAFDLECATPMNERESPRSRSCGRTLLRDMSYILVRDDYCDHPSERVIEALFAHDGASFNVDPEGDFLPPSASHNGGFKTVTGNAVLSSPADTARNPNMILILRSPAGFQYFNVDFDVGPAN